MARMTKAQWAEARRKWEDDPRDGFDWLAEEFGGIVSRQAFSQKAKRDGWTKGGAPEPREETPEPLKKVAQHSKKLAQQNPKATPKPAGSVDEMVGRLIEETIGPGRPTLYFPEYAERVYRYCLLGATNPQIADYFGVCIQTLYNWMKEHPEFLDAVHRGKHEADSMAAATLFRRAMGYTYKEIKAFCFQGRILTEEIPTLVHPDPGCLKVWLFNRRPELWKGTPTEPPPDLGKTDWDAIDGIYDEALNKAEERHQRVVKGRAERLGVKLEFVSDDEGLPDDGHAGTNGGDDETNHGFSETTTRREDLDDGFETE
jgi:hypothetical protein